ncbi:MAG: hypothetical protein ACYTHM_15820 [Planctomycetota bacterium]|jgi:predicted esterase
MPAGKSISITLFASFFTLSTVGFAGDEKVPEVESPGKAKPGTTAWTRTGQGMVYFLRVPKRFDKEKGARLIVFLHGSNMNGLQYLRTFEAKGWCSSDLLVCPNGEKGKDPFGANNFTFASAKFVAGVVKEVTAAFRVTRTYLGGHSQGGFVTFSAIMHYPDLFEGAFPMAGDCWMQNEPNLWEDKPEKMAKQKKIAIAIIHGKKDPVVSFSQGEHAYDVFNVMGYPMLKLFAPENLGHQFALSPVPEALEWLDALKGKDPKLALKCAKRWAAKGDWGDATLAARSVLSNKSATSAQKSGARAVVKKAENAAKNPVKAMGKAMAKTPATSWLPQWFLFRRKYGVTKPAASLCATYDKLRKEQRKTGANLFAEARGFFNQSKKEPGYEKLEELLKKAPCSFHAYYAIKWLEDREKK